MECVLTFAENAAWIICFCIQIFVASLCLLTESAHGCHFILWHLRGCPLCLHTKLAAFSKAAKQIEVRK